MTEKKSEPKYEEGEIPGSILIPAKEKKIKLAVFFIVLLLLVSIFPLVNYIGPWQATPNLKAPYLSWVDDPQTTMTISWETPDKCDSVVEYGLVESINFTHEEKLSAETQLHSITLKNLDPDTEYKYKIGTESRSDLWGLDEKTYTFKTAPSSQNSKFNFIVYGDNRIGNFKESAHNLVLDAILTEKNIEFTLNVGDLVHRPQNLEQWDRFFYEIKELSATMPYFTSLGNHEYDEGPAPDYGENYFKFFNFPQNGKNEFYYSFNYSNAHIIALNFSTSDMEISEREITWLENDLEKNKGKWNIVFFHVPAYSSGGHGENEQIIEKAVPLFENYSVVVFNGHDHHYEHMIVNDIHYIIAGGGGAPLNIANEQKPYSEYMELTFCYTVVGIDDDEMTITTKRIDGSVVDDFIINLEV